MTTSPDSLVVTGKAPAYNSSISYAEINCFIHVLRESDGTGGLSQAQIDSMILTAEYDLNSLDVYLYSAGQEDLPNSTYFNDPDGNAQAIFAENPHTNAIDIYLGPASGQAKGRASGIPGSALVLTGSLTSYSALSHLLGNCLGLYSTDEILFGVENPDGSNGGSAGDLVPDTEADPVLTGWVEGDCSFSSSFFSTYPGYSPDPENIMSNGRMVCWSTFSAGQRARVLTAVETYSLLEDLVRINHPGGWSSLAQHVGFYILEV